MIQAGEETENEKRKGDSNHQNRSYKKQRVENDIRDHFKTIPETGEKRENGDAGYSQEKENTKVETGEREKPQRASYYGEEEEVEMVDGEEEFRKHLEETRRIQQEREEKI